jgi:hypothetical protein
MDPVAEQECLGIAFHNRRLKAARFSHSGFSASHLRADTADDTAGKTKSSVPIHAKISCKHVLRPTKVRLARAKQRPFSTPVIKTLRLKVRVRLDRRAPQIKRSKLIERFACRPSVNNNRRASRAGYLRHPPASRLLLTPVCRMLSQRKTSVSQIAVNWTARQRVGPNSYSLLCEVTYCRE